MSDKVCSVNGCGKERKQGVILCATHERAYEVYVRRVPFPFHRSGWAKRRKAK